MSEEGNGTGRAETADQRQQSATDAGADRAESTEGEGPLDTAARAFLGVEERLVSTAGPWRAVDVEVIPGSAVPADYPREVDTDDALELTLRPPSDRVERSVYLPIPGDGVVAPDSDLGRLLATLDVSPDRFGDLHGRVVPVTSEAGALVVDTDDRSERGSERAIVALLAAYATLLGATLVGLAGAGGLLSGPAALLVLAVVNFVVLPAATYLDGWYLRSARDWPHAPGLWAILAVLPGLNLVSTAFYLLLRDR